MVFFPSVGDFQHDFYLVLARFTCVTMTPLRTVTPSRANRSSTIAAHSGSSLGERRRRLEHRDVGAEPPERLRELEPDRAGADHDEMLRPLAHLEHGLVGEVWRLVETRNRRHRRRRAGRDDEAPRLDLELIADRDGVRIREARLALDHPHAEPGEALPGIVRRDRRDHLVDVIVDLIEFDAGALRLDAERRRRPQRLGALGRGDHRLRRHAADVEAVAAHLAFLDQHHRHAERGGRGRDRQAAGAGADDAEVGRELLGHASARRTCDAPGANALHDNRNEREHSRAPPARQ